MSVDPERIPAYQAKIELTLNAAGYSGADIDAVRPDFMTDRPTTLGIHWWPAADGPHSVSLAIVVGIVLAQFVKGFATELSKDLYQWAKQKLVPLFRSKASPVVLIRVEFEDVLLVFEVSDFGAETTDLERFLAELPALAELVRATDAREWSIELHPEGWRALPRVRGNSTSQP